MKKTTHTESEMVKAVKELECGRKFRILDIIDDSDRVAVAQEVSMSFPAQRVIKVLEKVIWLNGKPRNIRCDNGPEGSLAYISSSRSRWPIRNQSTTATYGGKTKKNTILAD